MADNSILNNLFTDLYTIKRTAYTTTTGKSTKTLSTISTENRGRFEPLRGDIVTGFIGRVPNATHRLFTNISVNMKIEDIVIDEDAVEYEVKSLEKRKYFAMNHHLEVLLKERNRVIS